MILMIWDTDIRLGEAVSRFLKNNVITFMKAETESSHMRQTSAEKKSNLRQRLLKKTPNLSRLGNRSSDERGEITYANDSLSFLVDF